MLYAVSAMWNLHITVFNSKTDKEYRVRHNAVMDHADINTVFNVRTHYSATGKLPGSHKWLPVYYYQFFHVVTLVIAFMVWVAQTSSLCNPYRCQFTEDSVDLHPSCPLYVEGEIPLQHGVRAWFEQ